LKYFQDEFALLAASCGGGEARRASLAKAAFRNAAVGPHENNVGTPFTVAGIVRKHQSRMSDAFWLKACTDAVARQMENLPITLGLVTVSNSVVCPCCRSSVTRSISIGV
jgi:hypothetical protein